MKNYLATYIETKKNQKFAKSEPSKPSKLGFVGFDGSLLPRITEKQSLPVEDFQECPICTAAVKVEESAAVRVKFCPLGCSFLQCRFTDDRKAVWQAVNEMFDRMTVDELQAVEDALDERTAVFQIENGWTSEAAMRAAEQNVLPVAISNFFLRLPKMRKMTI